MEAGTWDADRQNLCGSVYIAVESDAMPASVAGAVVAALSEAALVSLDTTVAVLSASVALGSLLQLLSSRPPARVGARNQAKATRRKREDFMINGKVNVELGKNNLAQALRLGWPIVGYATAI
jgi:predicted phage tail protein